VPTTTENADPVEVCLAALGCLAPFQARLTSRPYMWLDAPRSLFYIVNNILNLPLIKFYIRSLIAYYRAKDVTFNKL
jgi:hypothetical protein